MAQHAPSFMSQLGSAFPAYFTAVMATGIVSIGAQRLGHPLLGWVLYGMNLFAFLASWICALIRLAHEPRVVWRDLRRHETGPMFLATVAGTGILGVDTATLHASDEFTLALFALTVLLWIGLVYVFLASITEGGGKPSLEKGFGGDWLLVVVATASVSVLGAEVLKIYGATPALVFFCYAWLLLAWLYYIVFASVIVYRFAFVPMPAGDVAGPWWINESAAANTVLAGSTLVSLPNATAGSLQIHAVVSPLLLVFWADATFWIPWLVLLFAWKHFIRGRPFRYNSGLWTVVYAQGMYAAATLQFETTFQLAFLRPAAQVLFWTALISWALTVIGLLLHLREKARPQPEAAPEQTTRPPEPRAQTSAHHLSRAAPTPFTFTAGPLTGSAAAHDDFRVATSAGVLLVCLAAASLRFLSPRSGKPKITSASARQKRSPPPL